MKLFVVKSFIAILFLLVLFPCAAHADGLLIPSDPNYPEEFMRSRHTNVTVTMHGLIAETVVYQEFVNDWHQSTDAVYAFPLPADARATLLLYNRGEVFYRAVLKVQEQSPNPGTGDGGTPARVNAYLGRNSIQLQLQDIAPGAVQKIELHYISQLDYHQGVSAYSYPLDTEEFITYPVDHLEFNFDIQSSRPITQVDIPSHPDYEILAEDSNQIKLRLRAPKSYLAKDLRLEYEVDNPELEVDFFATSNDSSDGHFALMVRPENLVSEDAVQAKRVVFLLNNSSRMAGFKLDQSILAISDALDRLSETDFFNLLTFNDTVDAWQGTLVPATAENITAAKSFLESVTGSLGIQLEDALRDALAQFTDDELVNAILLFTDGRAAIDPRQLATENTHRAGIFPIAIGDNVDRARLEMTASLNYGFVTYLDELSDLKQSMLTVFEKISLPVLRNPELTFDSPEVRHVLPEALPALYAGTATLVAGRFGDVQTAILQLEGLGMTGATQFDFPVDFIEENAASDNAFAALIWARAAIDELEREIDVYGETPALKDSVIALSLQYNIRSKYTAYIADYKEEVDEEGEFVSTADEVPAAPESYIAGNYPNPFSASTKFRVFLSQQDIGKTKLLKIYNILGQLVMVVDLTAYAPGWHEISFDGTNLYGQELPGGIYLVRLQVQNRLANTVRVHLVR